VTSFLDVARFLDHLMKGKHCNENQGIYVPGKDAIRCLSLSLEPNSSLYKGVRERGIDALFLHRPWQLKRDKLPQDVGVLSYHLAFDEQLTLGYNLYLAETLSLRAPSELGYKDERPIGMIGAVDTQDFTRVSDLIVRVFGGFEQSLATTKPIDCVAVVGAMTKKLVFEASARGANLYITGQWRDHAERAVRETGIGVITVGHERSEQWGLELLAQLLEKEFPGLETQLL